MDSAPKRPWYRLRWLTWLLLAMVAGAFISRQMEKELIFGIGDLGMLFERFSVGWPLQHAEYVSSQSMLKGSKLVLNGPISIESEWFIWPFLVNSAFGFVLVASTAIIGERWVRRERRLQINLQQILIAMATFGVLLTLSRPWTVGYGDLDLDTFSMQWSLVGMDDLRVPLRWPLLFALGCTIYSLGWLACLTVLRCWSLLRRT